MKNSCRKIKNTQRGSLYSTQCILSTLMLSLDKVESFLKHKLMLIDYTSK